MTEHAPYQSSAFPPPQAWSGAARPLGRKAWIAMVFLGLIGAEALAAAGIQAYLYPAAVGIVEATEAQIALDSFLYGGEQVLATSLLLLAGVAFISWLHLARTNLQGAGAEALTWTQGWSIGAWFVPLANLVVPQLVVSEIDRVSERRADEAEGRPHERRRGVLVAWLVLWSLFLLASQVGQPALLALDPGPSYLLASGFGVLEAVAAGSAILLVRRVTANQDRIRAAWLRHGHTSAGAAVPAFPAAPEPRPAFPGDAAPAFPGAAAPAFPAAPEPRPALPGAP